MFEVGFTEIALIFAIALLVLGPARLPKLAADLGRWAGRARAMARQLKTQLEQEASYDPLRDVARSPQTIHTPPPAPHTAAAAPGPAPPAAGAAVRPDPASDTPPGAPGPSDEPKPG